MNANIQRRAISLQEFADTFGLSIDSTKRLARTGELRTINIGARILVPVAEVERIEREGLGLTRRQRKAAATARA